MLSVLALLLSIAAQAGEIQVTVGLPVVVSVDGQVRQPLPGSMQVNARKLAGGTHLVEIRSVLGKPITEMTVNVDLNEQVRLRYARKALTELGRGELPERSEREPAPLAAAGPTDAAANIAAIQASIGTMHDGMAIAAGQPRNGSTTVSTEQSTTSASVQVTTTTTNGWAVGTGNGTVSTAFTGLDPLIHVVEVSGRRAQWVPGLGAFVITDLKPNTRYEFQLSLNGVIGLTNGMVTEGPRHETCNIRMLDPLTYAFDTCQKYDRALTMNDLSPYGVGGTTVHVNINTGVAQPVVPVVQPMSESSLTKLVSAVDDASFSSDQLAILRTAAARNHFTCAQVVRLLDPISHSSDQVAATKLLRPAVLDPENAYVLNEAFSFSSDRETVQGLFE